MSETEALSWINGAIGLHRHFRILYVVDGVEASICDDNDDVIIEAWGETCHEAVVELAHKAKQIG